MVVKHSAPFHGFTHLGQTITSHGCSASASFPVAPTFNLTTGIGLASGRSSVTGCGPSGFSDDGATAAVFGFDSSPVVDPTPSFQNWSVNFSFSFAYNLSSTPTNPAGGPSAWASYWLKATGDVWDLTTSSVAMSCTFLNLATTNGTTTGNVSGHVVFPVGCGFSGSLNLTSGHRYMVQIYLEAHEYAHAPAATSTHATARLNVATQGNQLRANSWSFS